MTITPRIETLWKAVEHYLANWDALEKGEIQNVKVNAKDCALCDLYITGDAEDYCMDCPIYLHTGYAGCLGTPWEELSTWVSYYKNSSIPVLEAAMHDGFRRLEAEYVFLLEVLFKELKRGN